MSYLPKDPAALLPRAATEHEEAERKAAGDRWRARVDAAPRSIAADHYAMVESRAAAWRAARAREKAAERGASDAGMLRTEAWQIDMGMRPAEIRAEYREVRARVGAEGFDERARALAGEKPTAGMWLAAARKIERDERTKR